MGADVIKLWADPINIFVSKTRWVATLEIYLIETEMTNLKG
jgi:hypothetical protein